MSYLYYAFLYTLVLRIVTISHNKISVYIVGVIVSICLHIVSAYSFYAVYHVTIPANWRHTSKRWRIFLMTKSKCWCSMRLESLQYIFWIVDRHRFHVFVSGQFCSGRWSLLFWLWFLTPRVALEVIWWPWISVISDRSVTCRYILQAFSLCSVSWDDIITIN